MCVSVCVCIIFLQTCSMSLAFSSSSLSSSSSNNPGPSTLTHLAIVKNFWCGFITGAPGIDPFRQCNDPKLDSFRHHTQVPYVRFVALSIRFSESSSNLYSCLLSCVVLWVCCVCACAREGAEIKPAEDARDERARIILEVSLPLLDRRIFFDALAVKLCHLFLHLDNIVRLCHQAVALLDVLVRRGVGILCCR